MANICLGRSGGRKRRSGLWILTAIRRKRKDTGEAGCRENYLISITGKQELDGETGEVNLTTLGSCVHKGDKRFIMYKEYAEGDAAPRTSVLKVEKGGKVTLMHTGDATRLILERGSAISASTIRALAA